MKRFLTLLLASLMLMLPLTADDDIIPLGVEDSSEGSSFDGMSDDEFYAYLENLADQMGMGVDELIDILKVDDDTISLEGEDGAAVLTTGIDDDEDLSAMRLYTNDATGYEAFIADDAGLLSDKEKDDLLNDMIPITQWGNAYFHTDDGNYGLSTESLAPELYEQIYEPGTSGTIFLIDMYERMLYIHSEGDVNKVINSNYARSITDNVYKLAGDKEYYACAKKAFNQIETLLAGGKIAQPMKHISNYLLALILALIICFIYMKSSSKTQDEKAQPKAEPIFNGTLANISVTKGRLTSRTIQSSSGGGSRGGGGGGHSGGGGGHRF